MAVFDWLLVIVFSVFLVGMGIYSMKYVRGITDFLVCGRVCGRYVISVSDAVTGILCRENLFSDGQNDKSMLILPYVS